MAEKPMLVDLGISEADVEAVITEYQAANPGKAACDMTPEEFADRMMKKVLATAKMIEGGNA
jgi:hypothetical protein